MIEVLKPYPAYKDSAVECLGKVPAHWEVRSLSSLTSAISNRRRPDLPLLSVVREKGVIQRSWDGDDDNHNHIPDDLSNYKVVRRGNLVINKMKAWQGSLGVASMDGIVSPAYFVFALRIFDSKYAEMLLRSKPYVALFARASDGVRIGQWDLSIAGMRRIPVVVPSPEEQSEIVGFIRHTEQRIRHYVRAKQKLIKLLEEQKQAIIHQAVTRGPGPKVLVKRTDNRWFPEVPEHWEALPMRRVILSTIDGPHFSPTYLDQGVPFLSARNVKVDRWSIDDAKFISEADYSEFCKRVQPVLGDILYTKGGTTGIARAVDLEFKFQVWVHIAVLKVNRAKIIPEFLAMALNSPRCYEQSQLYTRGATNQDLGLSRMKDIVLPVPPLNEQGRIVELVMAETLALARGIDIARKEIALLREYRTRLISDVVTGKLDVREAAARLPDEPDTFVEEPVEEIVENDLDELETTVEEEVEA
jgi:type I restriction enzyme S subunit